MAYDNIMMTQEPIWNRKELFRHSLPLLLLLSLSLGIVVGYYHLIGYNTALCGFVGVALLLLLCIVFRKRLLCFPPFALICSLLYCSTLFLLGCYSFNYSYCRHAAPVSTSRCEYQLVVLERVESKSVRAKFEAELLTSTTIDSLNDIAGKRIMLFLHRDSVCNTLKCGDILNVYGSITPLDTISNPDAFNYGKYLSNKGFAGELRPDSAMWTISGYAKKYRHRYRAQQIRYWIIEQYNRLTISQEELGILQAITLGSKSSLSTQQREEFSIAGASHVLAVSGLHVGIILIFLQFILFPLRYFGFTRRFYFYSVIAILWYYAYVTGLPPSVCRACLMITITWHSKLNSRYINAIESCIVSAIILLIINPWLLFDVGFQLSYFAVAAILVGIDLFMNISPKLCSHVVGKYFMTLLSLSVCAQIGTAPLVAYYFHRLPTYSIVSNFIVTPLAFVIVPCAILFLLCSKITLLSTFIGKVLSWLLSFLGHCVTMVADWPHSSTAVWLTQSEAILLSACVLVVAIALVYKYKSLIIAASLMVAIVIVVHPIRSYNTYRQMVVFHSPYNFFINIIDNPHGKNMMITDNPSQCDYVAQNFWTRHHCDAPSFYGTDSVSITITLPNQQTVAVVNRVKDCYRLPDSLPINYLIIADRYPYKPELLMQKFKADTIVIPSAIYPKYREQLINICINNHQSYYDVRVNGAFLKGF